MSEAESRREIDACTEKSVKITGRKPRFFRPPFIDVSPALFKSVELTFICGAGCRDWESQVSAQERLGMILRQAQDGQIVLLHDMPGNTATVEAVRAAIPELKSCGFRFVTCGELFDGAGVTPRKGRLYSNVYQTEDRV